MSDYTLTPNLGLYKPTPQADNDLWGDHWNLNADTLDTAIQSVSGTYIPLAQRAAINGVATLDGSGRVPTTQLPGATTGTISYQGTWNASTNTPVMASGALVGGVRQAVGIYYVVSVGATTAAIDGVTTWVAGDWISSNGTIWQRVQTSGAGPFLPLSGGVVSGATTLGAGGTFTGTFAGTHTYSGTVAFTSRAFLQGSASTGTTTGSSDLSINGAATGTRTLAFQAAGVARWTISGINTSLTGANQDTNLAIGAYTDAGTFNGFVLQAHRASGPYGNGVPTTSIGPLIQGDATGRGQATIPNGLVGNNQDMHASGDLQPAIALGTNPITTTAGSPMMTISYPNIIAQHTPGFDVWVLITGATAVGGITPNGTWLNVNNNALPRTPSAASWSGGNVTITTTQNHGLVAGQVISNSGFTPAGYNGTFAIASVPAGNALVYAAADPGPATVLGSVLGVGAPAFVVTAATWAGGNITLTTSVPHGILVGQQVTTLSFTPSGYNGTFTAAVGTTGSTIVVAAANPGAATALGLVYDPNHLSVPWTSAATSNATGGGSAATLQPSFAVVCNKSAYTVFSGANGFNDKNVDIFDVQPMWYQSQAANTGGGGYQQNWFVCMGPPDKTGLNLWGVNWAEIDLVNRGSDDGYGSNLQTVPRNHIGIWMGPTNVLANTTGSTAASWNTCFSIFSARHQGLGVYTGYSVQRNGLVPAVFDPTGHGGVGVDIYGGYTVTGQNPFTTAASGNSVLCHTRFPLDMYQITNGGLVFISQRYSVSGVTFGGNAPQTLTLAANPITTTSGSPILTIAMPNAGKQIVLWSTITLAGASAVGGITPNGTLTVLSKAANSFTARWTANATSATTGGGAAVVLGFNSSVYVMSAVNTATGFFTIFGSGNSAGVVSGGGTGQVFSFGDYAPHSPYQSWGEFVHGIIFDTTFRADDGMAVSAPAGNGYGWTASTGATAMVTADDDHAGNMNIILAPAGTGTVRMPGLPTSSAGLLSGSLWVNAGVLNVVP